LQASPNNYVKARSAVQEIYSVLHNYVRPNMWGESIWSRVQLLGALVFLPTIWLLAAKNIFLLDVLVLDHVAANAAFWLYIPGSRRVLHTCHCTLSSAL